MWTLDFGTKRFDRDVRLPVRPQTLDSNLEEYLKGALALVTSGRERQ